MQGLRREEVALLAGISVEYYIQLERGTVRGVSDDVVDAIARALQLDDVERTHLFDLVHAAKQRPTRRGQPPQQLRPTVQRVLDTITDAAAFVRNGRLEILSANRLGYALYSEGFANPQRPTSLARFVFLDPRSRVFYGDWNGIADATVGSLRAEAGRDPYDRELTDLVGELSMRSDDFRLRWATHDVRLYAAGTQQFHHTLVGDLTLDYEALELTADVGLTLLVYAAEPDSPSRDALQHLANWGATTPTDRSPRRTIDMTEAATTSGRTRGIDLETCSAFKGIPFAAPPTGDRRFRPPQPVEPWDGVRDCTRFGPICPLVPMATSGGVNSAFERNGPMDEDCLSLNVWTPAVDDAR